MQHGKRLLKLNKDHQIYNLILSWNIFHFANFSHKVNEHDSINNNSGFTIMLNLSSIQCGKLQTFIAQKKVKKKKNLKQKLHSKCIER